MVNVAKVRVHMSDDTGTGDADSGWREIVPANAPVLIDLVNLTNGQLKDLRAPFMVLRKPARPRIIPRKL